MKKLLLSLIVLSFVGCKTTQPTTNSIITENNSSQKKVEPKPEYKMQMENLEKGIYFRATGNEPAWGLKISEKEIEFTSLKPGFEKIVAPHVEPVRAMDANVKSYRIKTESGQMNIQISQEKCTNTMSGEVLPYSVKIDIAQGRNDKLTIFAGCGKYIIDAKLHDIWVLEKMNGKKMELTDFMKQMPQIEINSTTGEVHGFGGCNRISGKVFFERGLLRFPNMISTMMACGPNNKESEFVLALSSTTTYSVANMRLTLNNPSGTELVFRKVD